MALIPGRQLHLDSFQSSLSKFHGAPLQFIRCSSSVSVNSRILFPNSQNDRNPPRKSSSLAANRTDSVSLSISSNWFSGWNKPNKQSRPKPPRAVVNYRDKDSGNGGSGSTLEKIVEKLKKFGYMDGDANEKRGNESERVIEKGSVEDIFYVEEGMLPTARGGFSKESPLGVESVFKSDGEVRFPWEKPKRKESEEGEEIWTARRKSKTHLAELTLPESELRRLRNLTWQTKSKTKVGGRGVTQEVVEAIHEKWKTSEIVSVKVEGAAALNMKRIHEMLERKTGGLVIWRSGTSVSLYRGVSYEVPSHRAFKRNERSTNYLPLAAGKTGRSFPGVASGDVRAPQANLLSSPGAEQNKETIKSKDVTYEHEIDKLLDGLGPRYTDWPGVDPLPVDADMLPGTVPGYQPPFRMLPYGVRSTLGRKEGTDLRRLARVLPPHFALGRSRQLQGLAMAVIKLWEKSSIAKVALKRGVQLTTSERMAEDIKKLTGGMLLSRNKDFLVFYRGKDFLSPDVAEALLEKERLAKSLQDEEEQARLRASAFVTPTDEIMEQSGSAGTLEETLDANMKWGKRLDDHHKAKMMREVEIIRHTTLVKKLDSKMAFAERRLKRAERALSKVETFLKPAESQADPETITDEERYMFRKLGLRMKAFLLLGRRGLFDGTVENMHLHWKYRELVKIITKARSFEQVKKVALALERESGGVLVSVDKISKGYAIIVFRGKDYQRPTTLRPKNLLTKRRALARSIEIQRHEALLNHASALQTQVDKLRSEIEELNNVKDQGDEELYDRLDSTYPSDDDQDITEEQDEAYLETYNSENDDFSDDENENVDTLQTPHPETNFPYNFQNQESETEDEADIDNKYSEAYDTEEGDYFNDANNDAFTHNLPAKLPSQLTEKEQQRSVKGSINSSSD